MTKKLKPYAILLGGKHESALLELHDVKFVWARNRADAFQKVASEWFGTPGTAHVDAYLDLSRVDGHELVTEEESEPGKILFFVNLGSYRESIFGEDHQYCFMMGENKAEIKTRAKLMLSAKRKLPHLDHLEEIDLILAIPEFGKKRLYWRRSAQVKNNLPQNGYFPLKQST